MNIKDYVRVGHRLLNLIFWMILGYLAGDAGAGFFYVGFLIFIFAFTVLNGGLKETMAKMTATRVEKGFYIEAGIVFRTGLLWAIISGGLVSALFIFFGRNIMNMLYGYTLPYSLLGLFGLYYILLSINSCLMGYYQGIGYSGFCIIGEILESLVLIGLSPIIVSRMYAYGTKVAALLKEPLYANLNGAIGGIITQCIGIILSSIVVIAGLVLIHQNNRENYDVGGLKTREAFVKNYIRVNNGVLEDRIVPLIMLLAMAIIFIKEGATLAVDAKELFTGIGVFAGKYLVVMLVPLVYFIEYVERERRRIRSDHSKEERKNIRIRAGYLLKNTMYIMLPVCATAITLAKPIVMIFFGGRMSLGVVMVRQGGIVILLAALCYSLRAILKGVKLQLYGTIAALIGFVAMIAFLMSSISSGVNINLLVYSVIVYYLIQVMALCVLVYKMEELLIFDIGIKWAKVAVGTSILIIAEAVLDKFIVMNVAFLLLTLAISYALYFAAMGVLKGLSKKDINSLKGTLSYYPSYIAANLFDGR